MAKFDKLLVSLVLLQTLHIPKYFTLYVMAKVPKSYTAIGFYSNTSVKPSCMHSCQSWHIL